MHCGMTHTGVGQCPRVKAVEYYENGMVRRVEYHEPKSEIKTTFDLKPTWERKKGVNA